MSLEKKTKNENLLLGQFITNCSDIRNSQLINLI